VCYAAAVTASVTSGVMGGWTKLAAQVLQQAQCLGGHDQAAPPAAGPVELGVNHEILHHGQLIVYANALGRAFPASWAAFGL
jgi:uncharacterized damage-inducible protein DinB